MDRLRRRPPTSLVLRGRPPEVRHQRPQDAVPGGDPGQEDGRQRDAPHRRPQAPAHGRAPRYGVGGEAVQGGRPE
eukprot:8910753-Pyramimonas_sp.AAC.1